MADPELSPKCFLLFFSLLMIADKSMLLQLLAASMDEQRIYSRSKQVSNIQSAHIEGSTSALDCASINKKLDEILQILRSKPGHLNSAESEAQLNTSRSPVKNPPNRKARSRSDGQAILQDLALLASAQASFSLSSKAEALNIDDPKIGPIGCQAIYHEGAQNGEQKHGIVSADPPLTKVTWTQREISITMQEKESHLPVTSVVYTCSFITMQPKARVVARPMHKRFLNCAILLCREKM